MKLCQLGLVIHPILARFHAAGKLPSWAARRPISGAYAL